MEAYHGLIARVQRRSNSLTTHIHKICMVDDHQHLRLRQRTARAVSIVTETSTIVSAYDDFFNELPGPQRAKLHSVLRAGASRHASGKLPDTGKVVLANEDGIFADPRAQFYNHKVKVACVCHDFRASVLPCEHIFHLDLAMRGAVLHPGFKPTNKHRHRAVVNEEQALQEGMLDDITSPTQEEPAIDETVFVADNVPAPTRPVAQKRKNPLPAGQQPAALGAGGELGVDGDEVEVEPEVDAAGAEAVAAAGEVILTEEALNSYLNLFRRNGKLDFATTYLELSDLPGVLPADTTSFEANVNDARSQRRARAEITESCARLAEAINQEVFDVELDGLNSEERERVRDILTNLVASAVTRITRSVKEQITTAMRGGARALLDG